MVVIDTDVLIEFSKGNQKIIKKIKELQKHETLATTVFTAEELLFGLYFSGKEERVMQGKEMLLKLKIYNYTTSEIDSVIEVKVGQKKNGKPIGKYDEAIAGICLAKNESLFTLNKKHFSKVKGLRLR